MNITSELHGQLKKMKEVEDALSAYQKNMGWTWHEVGMYASTINKLLVNGLVRIRYKSASTTCYLLTEEGRSIASAGSLNDVPVEAAGVEESPTIEVDTSKMFSDITGYDDIKEILRECLQLDKPIHVLLVGPPSLAKSMFLWDIERAYGDQSMPLIGSATSHAGLWDLISERKPRLLLVDEIEKMSLTDMAALLSLMQSGRIIRTKVGRRLDEKIIAWVIGAANRTAKMPTELLSRFYIHHLSEYSTTEFMGVVKSVLIAHEDTDEDSAAEISTRLLGKTHDVRDAVRVARLAKRVGVKRAIELLIK